MIKKELTPLEAFKRIKNHCEKELIINVLYDYEKELRIVKKALKENEKNRKKLKAFDILKDYLYIDDKNTLRLRHTTFVNIAGIIFSDREIIDLLKEALL